MDKKYIVVRVCTNGGGNITPVLTKEQAIEHYNTFTNKDQNIHNLFVKVFDTDEAEYQVLTTWQTTGKGYLEIVNQVMEKIEYDF